MDKVYIYTLNDPKTLLVRYVGKTENPKERLRKHLSYKRNTYCSKWIQGLAALGLKPVMNIIEVCDRDNWQQKEKDWIQYFRAAGNKLANMAEGGEGGNTMQGRKLTADQSKKISLANKGRKRPDNALNNIKEKGKRVDQYDLSGNLITSYDSIRIAAKAINRDPVRIQYMCRSGCLPSGKKINHVGGFVFKYV